LHAVRGKKNLSPGNIKGESRGAEIHNRVHL
jgi:hypothetical protein